MEGGSFPTARLAFPVLFRLAATGLVLSGAAGFLLTTTDAVDCRHGGILRTTYLWHWTTPNP